MYPNIGYLGFWYIVRVVHVWGNYRIVEYLSTLTLRNLGRGVLSLLVLLAVMFFISIGVYGVDVSRGVSKPEAKPSAPRPSLYRQVQQGAHGALVKC